MLHFEQAFWSSDYAGGLGVLFGKLQQGVKENQQMLTIARMRADAEDSYGQHIGEIGTATDRVTDGFSKDDGASVRKAYDGVRIEMMEASKKHRKIASNLRELVVYPFNRWCDQHAMRVQNSQDDLQGRIKAHDRQAEAVRKLRSQYFNKCRLVEDLEEEDKLVFKDRGNAPPQSPKQKTPTVKIVEPESELESEPIEIGDEIYQPEQVKKILTHMLEHIRLGETKVPILGTYQNVSIGAEIVEYIQTHMDGTTVSYAERIGQDLVTNGYLRLVGNVGSTFANSSKMNYQWKPKAFQLTGLPEKKKSLERSSTMQSTESSESPLVGAVGDYLAGWNPLNNAHPNETPGEKLRREARETDERYKASVRKLDLLRCTLEEAIMEHLKFMERCELDRLKAIKSVILDFSGAISNVIPSLQSTVDNMMLFQETIQPLGDLRYFLENYRTGSYVPKVQIYENYYNSVDEQTFGVDLEARARSDRKRVPLLVTTILTYLDNHYPLLDGDEARRGIWLVDVPLAATHHLRNEINNGKPNLLDLLERYEVPIVASVLKLYLLELPDSLVSSSLYDIIKTLYSTPATADSSASASSTRISVLQNTLGQLRLANIATLDAIITHFSRLIDLTSADEAYTTLLAQGLASCILRPRMESSMSFEEKYSYRFLRDLLANKDAIFGELKRSISLSHSASVLRAASTAGGPPLSGRPRATSTDESNRRAHMEERNRAIASRSRSRGGGSPPPRPPAPDRKWDDQAKGGQPSTSLDQQRHHKRDSSKGPPSETRFPVHPATTTPAPMATTTTPRGSASGPGLPSHAHGVPRNNLDVPGGSLEASPVVERMTTATATAGPRNGDGNGNGNGDGNVGAHTNGVEAEDHQQQQQQQQQQDANLGPEPLENRDSLGRSRFARKQGVGLGLGRQGFGAGGVKREERDRDRDRERERERPVGVELTDKPMDD